ncbi:hypothetical protein NEAUS06_0502 [Nematocida ausubeli]|nr:hypothetical protein NEAUS06_0502 [Nematocida ausubeli]
MVEFNILKKINQLALYKYNIGQKTNSMENAAADSSLIKLRDLNAQNVIEDSSNNDIVNLDNHTSTKSLHHTKIRESYTTYLRSINIGVYFINLSVVMVSGFLIGDVFCIEMLFHKEYSYPNYLSLLVCGLCIMLFQLTKYTIDINNFYKYIIGIKRKNGYTWVLYSAILGFVLSLVIGIILRSINISDPCSHAKMLRIASLQIFLGCASFTFELLEVLYIFTYIRELKTLVGNLDPARNKCIGSFLSVFMFVSLCSAWYIYCTQINSAVSYLLKEDIFKITIL